MKVYLLCQGKRIKKKKTTVKKHTLYPVYNEALVFDVPASNIEDVSLVVKVIDYDRWAKEKNEIPEESRVPSRVQQHSHAGVVIDVV